MKQKQTHTAYERKHQETCGIKARPIIARHDLRRVDRRCDQFFAERGLAKPAVSNSHVFAP